MGRLVGTGGRLVNPKPKSECKYGDWRDNIDWKTARTLLSLSIIVVMVVSAILFFGG